MSLYNQSVSNVPLSMDGLYTGTFTDITINGVPFDPKNPPNIPINPTTTNGTYAPVFTNGFGYQASGALLVDGNFGLTFNPATDTLGTTNLYTNGSIYVGGVMTGTPSYYIGVNSSNNIVKFSAPTVPVPNQINVIGNTGYSQLYPAFLTSNSSGNQNVFVDTAGNTIYYNEVTQTLVVVNLNSTTLTTTGLITANTLKINSVPAGTINKYLAITATGEVIQAPTPSTPTQLLTTRTSTSTVYYPTFVSTNTTGDKSYFVETPVSGYSIFYQNNTVGGLGTLYIPQLRIDVSVVLPPTVSFSSTPPTTGSPVVYGLGIDAFNNIKGYVAGSPNITVTSTNQDYYPVFVSTTFISGVKDLYQDTGGSDFKYNPSTNLLTVSNLTVSGTTTISGYAPLASPALTGTPTAPTAGSGTNTTQIATTAFVTTAIGAVSGYLPLTGGTMTGTISFASGTNNLLSMYYNKFSQYINSITDTAGNAYILILTDAPNASPTPLVGGIVLQRATTILSGGTTRMEVNSTRVKVSTVELAVSSQTSGQLRMIWSETGIGTFWRNDNVNFFLLITANGDPYGVWNSLRPLYINLASGMLYSNNGQTFQGGTDTNYLTFQDGRGLTTATGSPFGNVSVYGTGVGSWNGYDINRRWCLMGWAGNTEAGFHDNTYGWIWRTTTNNFIVDRPSVIYTNVPQQTYVSNQVLIGSNSNMLQWGVLYSTYYYNTSIDWKYGVNVASFYKASATSILRCSGAASYWVSTGGMYLTQVNFYNVTTGTSNAVNLYQFTNNASNHVSFPIMAQTGSGLAVGTYYVYISHSGYSDGNDHLYILSEILPS